MQQPRSPIRRQGDRHLTPSSHFVCFAKGDSMDGGPDPIRHGDPLLFEWITGGSARDYVDQPVIVETSGKAGVAGTLRCCAGGRRLRSAVEQSVGRTYTSESNMRPVARLAANSSSAISIRLRRG